MINPYKAYIRKKLILHNLKQNKIQDVLFETRKFVPIDISKIYAEKWLVCYEIQKVQYIKFS